MTNDHNQPNLPPDDVIQAYLDGEATPEQDEQVRHLLKESAFCDRLAQFALDFACLHELAQQGLLEQSQGAEDDVQAPSPTPVAGRAGYFLRNRFVQAGIVLATAVLLFAAFLPFWLDGDDPKRQAFEKPVLGHIQQATATVLARDDGADERARPDMPFRSNDTLRTVGSDGFAILVFHDGTKLALAGDTTVVCTEDFAQKRIFVREGHVEADVARQPVGKPMVLVTPTAEARIMGTRLALSAIGNSTKLSVADGKVLLRRFSDGRSVTVPGGYQAVASTRSELAARPIPPVPDTWSEDLEGGLPEEWQAGQWVTDDLPQGSRGAVRAERRRRADPQLDELYTVTSNKAWTHGLFRIERDSYLNFTYRLEKPGWFHVFISVRPDDLSEPHFGNYECKDAGWWKIPAGGWQTASVPLAEFRRVPKADFKDTPDFYPRLGDVAYVVIFSSYKHDRGLEIDRMWVTRGKPAD